MRRLNPIRTPWKQRWRQFRFQALPLVVCLGAITGVALLWEQETGGAISGRVEAPVSEVASLDPGIVGELTVARFDRIEAGDTIAILIKTPPDVLRSSLAVLKAEIELTRMGWIDPVLDQQRNLLQIENLKIDWLSERADLAIDKIRLQQAEREYLRNRKLMEKEILSPEAYERSETEVEALRVAVREREYLVAQIGDSFSRVRSSEPADEELHNSLRVTLTLQEERLRLKEAELRPVEIKSPISGVISEVYRQRGEAVAAGEPIVTVRSPHAEGIIAYMREPIAIKPEVGMTVEVQSRRQGRIGGETQIVAVGPQIEAMHVALRRSVNADTYEGGLPIYLRLPKGVDLLPGERVDIRMR